VIRAPRRDVVITYSPIEEMTGHLHETFDYYLFLKERFSVGMLVMTELDRDAVVGCFADRFALRPGELERFLEDLVYVRTDEAFGRERVIDARDSVVLLTDGNIRALADRKILLASRKTLAFMCFDYGFAELRRMYGDVTYLQDFRIHEPDGDFERIDYVKKFYFDRYREAGSCPGTAMMYVTFQCRRQSPSFLEKAMEAAGYERYLVLAPDTSGYEEHFAGRDDVAFASPPVGGFFDRFSAYVYTPVPRRFDCSPRLVAECAWYGKDVDFYGIDYYDPGLATRLRDVRSDIGSLALRDGDAIVDVIKENL
jgi:hypothetical protein